jgi:hypothetical protein
MAATIAVKTAPREFHHPGFIEADAARGQAAADGKSFPVESFVRQQP